MPDRGGDSLAMAEPATVRTLLLQFLLMNLPPKDGSAFGQLIKQREGRSRQRDQAREKAGESSSSKGNSLKKEPAAAAPRKRASANPTDERRQAEECDLCALLVGQLGHSLLATQDALELSKEANDKKALRIDKVQKAQTKRWLKQEYRVALAAALEQRIEDVCETKVATLLKPVCDDREYSTPATAAAEEKESGGSGGMRRVEGEGLVLAWPSSESGHAAVKTCNGRGQRRCRALVEEHAEPLMRSVLDERGLAECTKLLPRCDEARLDALVARAEALAARREETQSLTYEEKLLRQERKDLEERRLEERRRREQAAIERAKEVAEARERAGSAQARKAEMKRKMDEWKAAHPEAADDDDDEEEAKDEV